MAEAHKGNKLVNLLLRIKDKMIDALTPGGTPHPHPPIFLAKLVHTRTHTQTHKHTRTRLIGVGTGRQKVSIYYKLLCPLGLFLRVNSRGQHRRSPAAPARARARLRILISPSVSSAASIFTRPLQIYHAKCKCRRVAPHNKRAVRFARDPPFCAENHFDVFCSFEEKKMAFLIYQIWFFRR